MRIGIMHRETVRARTAPVTGPITIGTATTGRNTARGEGTTRGTPSR